LASFSRATNLGDRSVKVAYFTEPLKTAMMLRWCWMTVHGAHLMPKTGNASLATVVKQKDG